MKMTILALTMLASISSKASAIEWITALGSCKIQSTNKVIELISLADPQQGFGVVAKTQKNSEGIEALVRDTQSDIAVYLRGRDLNTRLWIQREEISPIKNLHFGSYSKELQSWITCHFNLKK